jgi:hypothetical protein
MRKPAAGPALADLRMTQLPPLREVIAAHGLRASKALGQNFLLDGQLLARIAAIPGDMEGARVFEIGPGPGGLTRALLQAGAEVIAVERDARCLPALAELGDAFPGRLRVIEGDAMVTDGAKEAGQGAHIVANLPYNVGTALLVDWLEADPWPPWWRSATLMFQQEVAERIVAAPGASGSGAVAMHRPACAARPSLGFHAAAKSHVRRGPSGAEGGACGRGRPAAFAPDGRRIRPAPQDAAPEPAWPARRAGGAGESGHRFRAPGRNADGRGVRCRGAVARGQMILQIRSRRA